jgi:hypothetical protein
MKVVGTRVGGLRIRGIEQVSAHNYLSSYTAPTRFCQNKRRQIGCM